MKTGAVWAVAAVMALLAIGGCGGGDDETASASLTRSQFVKEANAVCKEAAQEREELVREAEESEALDDAGKEELVNETTPQFQEMIEKLRDLGPPKGDEQEIEAFISGLESGVEKIEEEPRRALESTAMFDKANSLSEKYGLSDCII